MANSAIPHESGAKCGAFCAPTAVLTDADPLLERLLAAWPNLPQDVRQRLVALAEGAGELS
jgi:hypothetical protein